MKKKKKFIKITIIIVILSVLIMCFTKDNKNFKLYDEFLFFKFLNNQENKKLKTNSIEEKYFLEVQYKNLDFTKIDLSKTISEENLVNKKIAPGVHGEFEIIIYSNKDTNYSVKIQNEIGKPTNLKFEYEETIVSNLKDLENILKGKLLANEERISKIRWFWEYESQKDEEDTNIGINLESFKFDICVIGEGR